MEIGVPAASGAISAAPDRRWIIALASIAIIVVAIGAVFLYSHKSSALTEKD